jgi:hypothetical protein
MTKKDIQKRTLTLLLSGKHPQVKKFAGKHVLVIDNKIIPLQSGEKSKDQLGKLKKTYGKIPTLVFVPRQDISYILWVK